MNEKRHSRGSCRSMRAPPKCAASDANLESAAENPLYRSDNLAASKFRNALKSLTTCARSDSVRGVLWLTSAAPAKGDPLDFAGFRFLGGGGIWGVSAGG